MIVIVTIAKITVKYTAIALYSKQEPGRDGKPVRKREKCDLFERIGRIHYKVSLSTGVSLLLAHKQRQYIYINNNTESYNICCIFTLRLMCRI